MRFNRRKEKFNRRKINNILSLSIVIMLFTVGYAFLTTNININGTGYINRAEWNVHFANIQTKTGSVTPSTIPTISNNTSITFVATLANPGDFYEFNVDVTNTGTIPAMIDSFTITPTLTTEQANYFDYNVTYSDGVALANKQILDAGNTETLTVSFLYKTLENAALYPFTDQSFQFGLTINYVQADSTAVEVLHPFTGIKYGVYPYANLLLIDNTIPTNAILHNNVSDALADWTNPTIMNDSSQRPFYLKHKIDNDIVKESYVVFVITPEMAQANSGLIAGTYEIRGGVFEDVLEDDETPIFDLNSSNVFSAFPVSYCTNSSSFVSCYLSNLEVSFHDYGTVYVRDNLWTCWIYVGKSSYCSLN